MTNLALSQKTVFITGASSGIGAACARLFAAQGARLLLCARRHQKLVEVAQQLRQEYQSEVHTLQLDVTQWSEVQQQWGQLPAEWQQIDILVNNAGLSRGLENFQEGHMTDWHEMIDANVKGLLQVTRMVLPDMVERNQGHIINIGSVAGHQVYPKGAVYCATKHAVRALSQGLRMDLAGTKIRVSSVDPGAVETEFSLVRFHGDAQRAAAVYHGFTPLSATDVADAVLYCAQCPPHVNVSELLLMPTDQAAATMINRKS